MKLNVGCGKDKWGDIRLDIGRKYKGEDITPNFIGDAQNLPFRDRTFSEVKASHILEELPDWKKALTEWTRVCGHILVIKFPIDDGFKIPIIHAILSLNPKEFKATIKCRKQKCHWWVINPDIVSRFLEQKGFNVIIHKEQRRLPTEYILEAKRKYRSQDKPQ